MLREWFDAEGIECSNTTLGRFAIRWMDTTLQAVEDERNEIFDTLEKILAIENCIKIGNGRSSVDRFIQRGFTRARLITLEAIAQRSPPKNE